MRLPERSFDAIVIGGGHNGLVAAAYLARAGRRVVLLEASETLGGALATGEISPDYRVSTAAHLVEAMPRRIEKDLKLARHGLRFAERRVPTIALARDKKHFLLSTRRADPAALNHRNAKEADAYAAFSSRIALYAKVLAPLLGEAAPVPASGEAHNALRQLFWRAERLGPATIETLFHDLPGSIGDLVSETFETEPLKAAIAFEAVRGTADGPFSPGTVFRLIHRTAMRLGTMGHSAPLGGLGGLVDALARAADGFGAVIRTSTPVARIHVENGVASGVETTAGEIILAPLVLSSANPRRTMIDLVGAAHLDARLAKRMVQIGPRGATAKLNLALDGLPTIQGLAPIDYGTRLLVVPSLEELDEAFIRFKRGEFASEPVMEVTIPSLRDAALAPAGHHVMSVLVQYVPYEAKGGWAGQRDRLLGRIVDTLSLYAPDLGRKIVAGELLLPPDIEEKFGLAGGDWHHGVGAADRFLMLRPTPDLAAMRTPLKGLYLCGAGAHPGGGISGLPGKLAAELAMADRRRA